SGYAGVLWSTRLLLGAADHWRLKADRRRSARHTLLRGRGKSCWLERKTFLVRRHFDGLRHGKEPHPDGPAQTGGGRARKERSFSDRKPAARRRRRIDQHFLSSLRVGPPGVLGRSKFSARSQSAARIVESASAASRRTDGSRFSTLC